MKAKQILKISIQVCLFFIWYHIKMPFLPLNFIGRVDKWFIFNAKVWTGFFYQDKNSYIISDFTLELHIKRNNNGGSDVTIMELLK